MNIGHKIRLKRTSTSFWNSNIYIYVFKKQEIPGYIGSSKTEKNALCV